MEEQKLLRKQFYKHMFYNMIAFAVIFIAFGIFMFVMVKNITFSSVNKQLYEAKNMAIGENDNSDFLFDIFSNEFEKMNEEIDELFYRNITRKVNNPQISLIVRDKNGQILNENELGRIKNYAKYITFDSSNINNIYTFELANKYNYRCLNFIIDSKSEDKYVQLLINVDSEMALINDYEKIIFSAVIFGIILSGIASLFLSTKTLKPVQDTLAKQTEFVQNASHELRTPLTIIQAKQELLLQEPNAKIIDKSEDIMLTLSETKRLSKLTKDLMILVRGSDSKSMKLHIEDVEIDEMIENLVQPYIEIAQSQEKGFQTNLQFKKIVGIDTSKIHQLLVILLDNAIKYTEKGDTIGVNTYLKDNKCIIEIFDTGIGISDEGLNRVFERFYREDRARNRQTGGSGLGLSIASMIVSMHSGTIKASHNKPKGTIFTIKLPH